MLTSLQNPLVKHIRKLHRPQGRRQAHQCLLEGTHLVEVACQVNYPLITVCCTPHWQSTHAPLFTLLHQTGVRLEQVSPEVLSAMVTTVHPDGVVAIAHQRHPAALPIPFPQWGLALETIQDPGNMGTLIRTAVATGVGAMWVSQDSVDIHHPKVLRASAGEWFRLPMEVCRDLSVQVQSCRRAGIQVIATIPTAPFTYWQVDFNQPTLILLGNEGEGLSSPLLDLADVRVSIPLQGGVESLNVSIAAALLLYEARRQCLPC
ncbi:MAG: RNA methyltransferase [Synechococcales bacterium]|nr:RNA methyltransferase [Cyanobacteria bacterium REEB444]MEB3124711.1 RNA methyltransferase [Synechococcales bacterium]